MKLVLFPIFLSALSVFLNGCNPLNCFNDFALSKDVQKLLKNHNINIHNFSCQMENLTSRAGFCRYKANPDQNKKLVKKLRLNSFILSQRSIEELENDFSIKDKDFQNEFAAIYYFSSIKNDSCWINSKFTKTSKLKIYRDLNINSSLYTNDGRRFERFLLIYSELEGMGCFQIQYAYG